MCGVRICELRKNTTTNYLFTNNFLGSGLDARVQVGTDRGMSKDRATYELECLWKAVFGGPPSIKSQPEVLADYLVRCLPPAPAYRPCVAPIAQPFAAAENSQADRPASAGDGEETTWKVAATGA